MSLRQPCRTVDTSIQKGRTNKKKNWKNRETAQLPTAVEQSERFTGQLFCDVMRFSRVSDLKVERVSSRCRLPGLLAHLATVYRTFFATRAQRKRIPRPFHSSGVPTLNGLRPFCVRCGACLTFFLRSSSLVRLLLSLSPPKLISRPVYVKKQHAATGKIHTLTHAHTHTHPFSPINVEENICTRVFVGGGTHTSIYAHVSIGRYFSPVEGRAMQIYVLRADVAVRGPPISLPTVGGMITSRGAFFSARSRPRERVERVERFRAPDEELHGTSCS